MEPSKLKKMLELNHSIVIARGRVDVVQATQALPMVRQWGKNKWKGKLQ
jgi:hypothetical protein